MKKLLFSILFLVSGSSLGACISGPMLEGYEDHPAEPKAPTLVAALQVGQACTKCYEDVFPGYIKKFVCLACLSANNTQVVKNFPLKDEPK
jgi:hypothetical protein